jgi:hypothetical protein
MTQDEIQSAFESKFDFKAKEHPEAWVKGVKALCLYFFEVGIKMGNDDCSIQRENPMPACSEMPANKKDMLFTTWWRLYDLKVGKEACFKKFCKLSLQEIEACIAYTPAYVASTPDKQFRKRPLTFLNQKAWNDEIIPRNNAAAKPSIEQQNIDKLASILTE